MSKGMCELEAHCHECGDAYEQRINVIKQQNKILLEVIDSVAKHLEKYGNRRTAQVHLYNRTVADLEKEY